MMQQIYLGLGGASALALTVSSTTTNLDLATLFNNAQSGVWADSQDKTLIIDSGVIVGATATSNAALTIPSGMGGTLTIINNGAIQGAGGAVGAAGGDAIQVLSSGVIITNNGDIYAGGGGGGNGGTGGTGGNGSYAQTLGASTTTGNSCNNSCTQHFNSSAYCASANTSGAYCDYYPWYARFTYRCSSCRQTSSSSGGSGGSGGTGGVGQGYNQSAGSGSSGSSGSSGGTNAGSGGSGGAGGAGGAFGASGSTGSTGSTGGNGNVSNGSAGSAGSSGGAAGDYISGLANVTLTNNGNVAGTTS